MLGEVIRAAPDHAEAAVRHEVLELLAVVDLLYRGGELGLHVRRQALRAGDGAPGGGLPVRAAGLGQGRDVREGVQARVVHDGEHLDLAGLHQRPGLDHRGGDRVDTAGGEIGEGRSRTLGRDPADGAGIHAGLDQHAGQRQVPDAALAGARGLHAARVGLGVSQQGADVVVLGVDVDGHAGRIGVVQRDRGIVLVAEFGQADPMHHRDLDRDDADRVAVRLGRGDGLVADDAAAAGAVDHVHRHAELVLHDLGDHPAGGVGAAAGGPGHDHLDRALGIFGAGGTVDQGNRGHGNDCPSNHDGAFHLSFPPVLDFFGYF